MSFESDAIAEFERRGTEQVHLLLTTGGYNANIHLLATEWLAGKRVEASDRQIAEDTMVVLERRAEFAEQRQWNRSTAVAAWIAAVAAVLGTGITIWASAHHK